MGSLTTWFASTAAAINPKIASHRSAGHFAASFLAFGAFVIATQAALPEGARTSVILLFFIGYPAVLLGAAVAAIRLNAPGFVAGPAAYTIASIAIIGQLMPQALAHARPDQAVFRIRAPQGSHDIVLDASNAERLARRLVQEGKAQSVFYVQRRRIQRVVAASVPDCIPEQRCLTNRNASPGDEHIEYSSQWSPAAGFNREILREKIDFVGTGGRRTLAEKTTLGRRDVLFIVPMPVFILLPSLASSGLTGESALRDTAPLLSEFFDQVRR
ncbi:hypothetical protein [Bosea sp. RAC05]|uniref:hypothetical protein n=1 Tax=Bosea sp. RAC05 TaxID=1842539 RepID=UPI00083D57AF|nr:hypothetical protein [Bosea sp. RAC05]AOG03138.1 hypothetical protein BSY19_4850 [Bosea sp. RAC05]